MADKRSVWYQIRPNKFVDRRIFMDLAKRWTSHFSNARFFYASMGASHMVDHNHFYRHTGNSRLFSFDGNNELIARQLINRPVDSAICERLWSNELPAYLDVLYERFPDATNSIIWLDYMSTDRFAQLQELAELLKVSRPNDLIRITLNAHTANLGPSEFRDAGFNSIGSFRASQARENLGEFYDETFEELTGNRFPALLSNSVRLAENKARDEGWEGRATPVLLTEYQDGQRMFTATLVISDGEFDDALLGEWDFKPNNWTDILSINVPELSAKEKFLLDQNISKTPENIIEDVGFLPGEDRQQAIKNVESYKALHRFVPAFHNVEFV